MNALKIVADASIDEQVKNISGGYTLDMSLSNIIHGISILFGVIAVVMVIMGGIMYMTSQGDAGKAKKGRDAVIAGLIGLGICILASAIVDFVLKHI